MPDNDTEKTARKGEVLEQLASKAEEASEKLAAQQKAIEEKDEKLAELKRRKTAEEIVQMKVAHGTITSVEDFLGEVEAYVESDRDLDQIKIAMREGGPSFGGTHSLTEVEDDEGSEKEASTRSTSPVNEGAHAELEQTLAEMDVE